MKKLISLSIIIASLFFSSINISKALEDWYSEWSIEWVLSLTNWPEINKLENLKIISYNFKSQNFIDMTNIMLVYDRNLKNEIIQNYIDWNFSYTKMNWIITQYSYFVYNLNKYFEWNRKLEKYSYMKKDEEVKSRINNYLEETRLDMNRIKYLIYEQN